MRFHSAGAWSICLRSSSPACSLGDAPLAPRGLSLELGSKAPRLQVLQLGFVSQGDPTSCCEELGGLKASLPLLLGPFSSVGARVWGCYFYIVLERGVGRRGDVVLRRRESKEESFPSSRSRSSICGARRPPPKCRKFVCLWPVMFLFRLGLARFEMFVASHTTPRASTFKPAGQRGHSCETESPSALLLRARRR